MSNIVRMVRDPSVYPAPHTADVDETEVEHYRRGGYVLTTEANFEVPEQQASLQFADKSEKSENSTDNSSNGGTQTVKPQF